MSIDPRLVRKIAAVMAAGGPDVSREMAQALAADLHSAARQAVSVVGELTGLTQGAKSAGEIPVYVLDRPGWAYAAAQSFAQMSEAHGASIPGVNSWGVGAGTAVLSRLILGQFDPFTPAEPAAVAPLAASRGVADIGSSADVEAAGIATSVRGRLLLNAPNIASFREKFNLDQRDLCLWVCVHELTHAVQFAAAPWLRGYIVKRFLEVINDPDENGALDSPPAQELNTAMSVLEGHAEFVMNAVDLAQMPSKERLISAMNERRSERRPLAAYFVQWLGFDKKMEQYRTGAHFVRQVIESASMEAANLLWRGEEFLPSAVELGDPARWLERVAPCSERAADEADER
ncbi:MAG: zinc-dependent metalloprotease [Arcanobacterium sp.]|nr:zinc-dependent metalloprotease [Arcanobacterium sp.]MDY5589584.1 zinc-dependent metalloprotease [Arcanobacterium sp.]